MCYSIFFLLAGKVDQTRWRQPEIKLFTWKS